MRIIEIPDGQGSEAWLTAKAGVITGTRLKDVMGTKARREDLKNTIIAEMLTGKYEPSYTSKDMQRGIDEEQFAIKEYEKRTGKKTKEFELILHEKYDWIGLSPDRLTKKMDHGVEVKSPKSKTLVKYIRENKIPNEYKWQVVHYFVVVDTLKTLDFIVFDERIKLDSLKMFTISVTRKQLQEEIKAAETELQLFWQEVMEEYNNLTF